MTFCRSRFLPLSTSVSMNGLMILAGLGLFAYTCLRAYLLSFTHDESLTWLWFVHLSVPDIFLNAKVTGNNHILNTLLMKGLSALFGDSELVLRLPGLAGQVLYLVFSIRILQGVRNPWVRALGFVMLNINPYLLDFFSLARGYGLSMGMMMAFLYYQVKWMTTEREKYLTASLAFLVAGILANITIALWLFAAWVTTLLRSIPFPGTAKNNRKNRLYRFLRVNIWFLSSLAILVVLLWIPLSRLIHENRIDYGGETGFWYDTVSFLFKKSCYDLPHRHLTALFMGTLLVLSMAGSAVFGINLFRKSRSIPWEYSSCFFTALFLVFALGTILQHTLFGTPYLQSRTALSLWPLISLIPVFFLEQGSGQLLLKRIASGFSAFLIILVLLNFSLSANLTHTLEWRYDADTEKMLEELSRDSAAPDKQVVIGCSWVFEPTLNYYRLSKRYTWMKEVTREGPFIPSDFQFVTLSDADSLMKRQTRTVSRYSLSGNILIAADSGFVLHSIK